MLAFAKKKPYLRLANKNKILRWAKEHRHWTEELCLEGQHPGVGASLLTLRLIFCGYYLMKLPVEDLRRLFKKGQSTANCPFIIYYVEIVA